VCEQQRQRRITNVQIIVKLNSKRPRIVSLLIFLAFRPMITNFLLSNLYKNHPQNYIAKGKTFLNRYGSSFCALLSLINLLSYYYIVASTENVSPAAIAVPIVIIAVVVGIVIVCYFVRKRKKRQEMYRLHEELRKKQQQASRPTSASNQRQRPATADSLAYDNLATLQDNSTDETGYQIVEKHVHFSDSLNPKQSPSNNYVQDATEHIETDQPRSNKVAGAESESHSANYFNTAEHSTSNDEYEVVEIRDIEDNDPSDVYLEVSTQ
jgi:hypothetical protein